MPSVKRVIKLGTQRGRAGCFSKHGCCTSAPGRVSAPKFSRHASRWTTAPIYDSYSQLLSGGLKVDYPSKLTPDLVREALLELRFSTEWPGDLVVGKLVDVFATEGWTVSNMPAREIPEAIRLSDPALRFLATYELRLQGGTDVIRVGPNVLSHHTAGPYIGWANFRPKLIETVEKLLPAARISRIERCGLRYINVPTAEDHGISSFADLNLSVQVGGSNASFSDVSIAYGQQIDVDLDAVVRVVTSKFIGTVEQAMPNMLIDIDMFTPNSACIAGFEAIVDWIERAHEEEKKLFFGLLTPSTLETLGEN